MLTCESGIRKTKIVSTSSVAKKSKNSKNLIQKAMLNFEKKRIREIKNIMEFTAIRSKKKPRQKTGFTILSAELIFAEDITEEIQPNKFSGKEKNMPSSIICHLISLKNGTGNKSKRDVR